MNKFLRYGAFSLIAGAVLLVPYATAAPITPGSNLAMSSLDSVAVNLQYIDMDFTGVSSGTPPIVQSGTVDGSGFGAFHVTGGSTNGDFAGLGGTTAMVSDLCRTGPGACPADHNAPVGSAIVPPIPFITLSNGWVITMDQLVAGDFGQAGCLGAPGSGTPGQTCTPNLPPGSPGFPLGLLSPFDLTNNGTPGGAVTGVGIQFTFLGTITEGANGTAPVKGTFSTTFNSTDLQTILDDIFNKGETVTSSAQATVGIQAIQTTPEPSSVMLLLIGGVLIGATRIRRTKA